MIFPVIIKINAELVKKVKVAMQDTMSDEVFKHSMASNSKGNSSDSLCMFCLSANVTSLLVSNIKVFNPSDLWARSLNDLDLNLQNMKDLG